VPARRIPGGAPARPLVRFTFDGHEHEGFEGEPLAVSLLAAGQRILSRSFRFHRPRGLMCSTGQCGWCECEVDGVPSVRSCRVPVREGSSARGEHAWPSVGSDAARALGLVSRWIPPTFYHHRFLRPRRLRKRYLDVLRWFGGRGPAAVGRATGGIAVGRSPTVETDVLVVGGGRPGLQAAIGGGRGGRPGPARRGGTGDRHGPRSRSTTSRRARRAGVGRPTSTTAIGWYDGGRDALRRDGHLEIAARSVVAATGSYDRVPLVPGADRPGVIAPGRPSRSSSGHGVVPGERALLVGSARSWHARASCCAAAGIVELHGRSRPTRSSRSAAQRVAGADVRDRRPAAARRRRRRGLRRSEPEPRPGPRGGRGGRPR
jgi:sarcosine oxidase subunit alpha